MVGTGADLDVAEDLGPGTDHRAATDLGVAIASLLAGAAQGDVLQDRDVVLDDRRRADHQSGRMIQEQAPPEAGGRMDVGLEDVG